MAAATTTNSQGTYSAVFGEDYQRHLLSVAARIPTFVIKFRSALSHTYFKSQILRTVAKALFAYVDQYKGLPSAVTLQQLAVEASGEASKDAVVAVVGRIFQADVSDANSVIDRVVEFWRWQQAMINAVLSAVEKLETGDRNIFSLIQQAQMVGEDLTDLGIDYKNVDRAHWYDDQSKIDLIPTAIPHLDAIAGRQDDADVCMWCWPRQSR